MNIKKIVIKKLVHGEYTLFFISVFIFCILSMSLLAAYVGYYFHEQNEILNGPPTHDGIVTSADYSTTGFQSNDITYIVIDNRSVALEGIVSGWRIGEHYQIWVQGNLMIKRKIISSSLNITRSE